MDGCLVEDCAKIAEVKSVLKEKVSIATLTLVAGITTICIGAVVALYGYIVQGTLSRVISEETQITTNTILASENRVDITNLKRSLPTRAEFKAMLRDAVDQINDSQ